MLKTEFKVKGGQNKPEEKKQEQSQQDFSASFAP